MRVAAFAFSDDLRRGDVRHPCQVRSVEADRHIRQALLGFVLLGGAARSSGNAQVGRVRADLTPEVKPICKPISINQNRF